MRVAIIGGGPRGLWAAERLLDLAAATGARVDVDVWDDRPLGEGSGYRRDQPQSWRLNVTSAIVGSALGSLDDWRRARGESEPLDAFPPRALVGTFLAESWAGLVARVPAGGCLVHVPRRAGDVHREGGAWLVDGAPYDEVLLATGHAAAWPGALASDWSGPGRLTPTTPEGLSAEAVPPGATVACRGAALTFIDVALALTEGRDGRFEPDGAGVRYVRSGQEPAVIRPTSRSGRFMAVKPEPGGALAWVDLADAIAEGSAQVAAASDLAALTEALADTASAFGRAAGRELEDAAIRAVLSGADATGDPVAELRESWEVAVGVRPPSAAWAVGEAWRKLYPAIVARASFEGRATLPGFGDLAHTLERVAFGPPPVNAAKLLALLDAGVVDAPRAGSELAEADVVVDAVIAPPGVVPGTLVGDLVADGVLQTGTAGRGVRIARDGSAVGAPHLAVVGRDTEDVTLGNDTLSRTLHDVVERWAQRVIARARPADDEPDVHGTPPLTARLEPWLTGLLADPDACDRLLVEHGSPVNVLDPTPALRNAAELVDAGRAAGVDVRVFFARKANKALAFVDALAAAGHGVDVASERELRQVLDAGVPGERVILSAAVKPDALLRLAVEAGVTVSVDSVAELDRLAALAGTDGVRVAPRLAPDPATLPPTRFGERLATWRAALRTTRPRVEYAGVHVHLHGYAAADRRTALGEALELVDALVGAGHAPAFVDLGGGVPMSYLDDGEQWAAFQSAREAMVRGDSDPFTWKAHPLANTYPYHQAPVRGGWLSEVLGGELPDGGTAADGLSRRGLRLHLEPGRSLLDGCGATLARVAFTKQRSDGVDLVGLEMNRTQCRSTSDDFLVDPLLVRRGEPGRPVEAFLVGAYCIEDELILLRRMRFPRGVRAGDVMALPNTAGYLMHILESASHQIPLARNVVRTPAGWVADRIDG